MKRTSLLNKFTVSFEKYLNTGEKIIATSMDYCTPHFGRSLNTLTYDDVVAFFQTAQPETDQIEFKSFAPSFDESINLFSKAICGFLNSSGGLLVCGAPRGQRVGDEKVFVGNLVPWNQLLGHDNFVNRCIGQITPLPNSVRIRIIETPAGGSVCLVEVDPSDYSPHQQRGGVYYMRIDGQTQPAPHHYVEALMRKVRYPQIEGYIRFYHLSRAQGERFQITMEVMLFNWSALINAKNVSCQLITDVARFASTGTAVRRAENVAAVIHLGAPHRFRETIIFDLTDAFQQNGMLNVSMLFGGENTPLKSSDYQFQLPNPISMGNPEQYIILRQENRMIRDIQEANNQNRETILTEILGRRP